jgi:hypothetical protein
MRTSQFFPTAGAGLALAVLLALSSPAAAVNEADAPEEIQKLHEAFYAKTHADRQLLLSKQAELDSQIYSPTPDDKKIRALTGEIAALRARLFEADVELQRQLVGKGAPAGYRHHGRRGWGYGHRGGGGGPYGGCGYGGRGPHGDMGRHW